MGVLNSRFVMGEPVRVLTHGVTANQLYYIVNNEAITPSKYWGTISLSINGYFNLFAYRDAILIFDFYTLVRKYKLNPVFYVPHITDEIRQDAYGLSPLNLFWEMEIYTKNYIPIHDVSAIVIMGENGVSTIPNNMIKTLEETYAIDVYVGTRRDAFYGTKDYVIRYMLHLMKLANYPSLTNDEPPEKVLKFVDSLNMDIARLFGVQYIYEQQIRPRYMLRKI